MEIEVVASTAAADFRDIVLGLSAAVTAGFAALGIGAWRNEMKGRVHYDLARRYLLATLKVRDGLTKVRNPMLAASEYPEGYDFTRASPTQRMEATRHVYSQRWDSIREEIRDFQATALEAEVHFGSRASEASAELQSCIKRILIATGHIARIEGEKNVSDQLSRRAETDAWDSGEDNEMTQEILARVALIEEVVRPYL